MWIRLTPVVLSFVLLAAHFSRHDVPVFPLLCLAMPLVLLVKKSWVPRLLQLLLALGALEWLRTAVVLSARRMDAGEAWVRMAVILGCGDPVHGGVGGAAADGSCPPTVRRRRSPG